MSPLLAVPILMPSRQGIVPVPARLSGGGFYSKMLDFEGMPILASSKVDDRALFVARDRFAGMLRNVPRAWVRQLGARGTTFSIIAEKEQTLDLPAYRYLKSDKKTDWNKRARGFGGSAASAAEENILESPTDRYRGESVLVHEFAHTLDSVVFSRMDPRFRPDLKAAYAAAKGRGLWSDSYGGTNVEEYWAVGVACYFDCNGLASPPDGVRNGVANRFMLQRYDPGLFRLIDRAFDHNAWRYPGRYNRTSPFLSGSGYPVPNFARA